jgi:hypothetical protein
MYISSDYWFSETAYLAMHRSNIVNGWTTRRPYNVLVCRLLCELSLSDCAGLVAVL